MIGLGDGIEGKKEEGRRKEGGRKGRGRKKGKKRCLS